jgi:hypothetical protein
MTDLNPREYPDFKLLFYGKKGTVLYDSEYYLTEDEAEAQALEACRVEPDIAYADIYQCESYEHEGDLIWTNEDGGIWRYEHANVESA